MALARHEYSEETMEANRIKFYERFAKDQPHLTYEPTFIEPTSAIICENYRKAEKRGRVKISCLACRESAICRYICSR